MTVDSERAVQITGAGFANTGTVVCRLPDDTLGTFDLRGVFLDTTSVRRSVADVTNHVLVHEWDVLLTLNDVDFVDANATVVLTDMSNVDRNWFATVVIVAIAPMLVFSIVIVAGLLCENIGNTPSPRT
mgnify:CR=1 FL=1